MGWLLVGAFALIIVGCAVLSIAMDLSAALFHANDVELPDEEEVDA
jgi:hypothetical protein